jgi:diguanylate cyclase (GGDEF)-like protein
MNATVAMMNEMAKQTAEPKRAMPTLAVSQSQEALALGARLHTTLDVERVLELFIGEFARQLRFDAFEYRLPAHGVEFLHGLPAAHRCGYRLLLNEEFLGEVTVSRSHPFAEHEISHIEVLLSGLLYALRNALLYRIALESARRDPLTGLGNRQAYDMAIQREIRLARRLRTPLSLIVIDIDKFKRINDTHGHVSGDRVLRKLADVIRESVRLTDIACRYGGEEFVILLPGTHSEGAALLAERVRKTASEVVCMSVASEALRFTVSLGIASLYESDSAQDLLDRADHAMYEGKQRGGNLAVREG